jgi:hypothetical protein
MARVLIDRFTSAEGLANQSGHCGERSARQSYRFTAKIGGNHHRLVLGRVASCAYARQQTGVAGVGKWQPRVGEPSGMTLNLEAVQAENGVSSVYERCLRQEKGDVGESQP